MLCKQHNINENVSVLFRCDGQFHNPCICVSRILYTRIIRIVQLSTVSVCLSAHISRKHTFKLHKFLVHIVYFKFCARHRVYHKVRSSSICTHIFYFLLPV